MIIVAAHTVAAVDKEVASQGDQQGAAFSRYAIVVVAFADIETSC